MYEVLPVVVSHRSRCDRVKKMTRWLFFSFLLCHCVAFPHDFGQVCVTKDTGREYKHASNRAMFALLKILARRVRATHCTLMKHRCVYFLVHCSVYVCVALIVFHGFVCTV